jgi:putative hydrolase of the HAD superfamily
MQYSTIFIDLDETVYPPACGVWEAISDRMERYMHERLGLPLEEIPTMRKTLFQQYGTTLRGLQMTRHIDERDYLDFVHDVGVDRLLKPDPGLREVLLRYPQRKIILTNADRTHSARVIRAVGLEGCFESIIDIYDIAPYCKPMPEAYQAALRIAGETAAERCVFIDDSPLNLDGARALGFLTIQVGLPKPGFEHPQTDGHPRIARLNDLPTILALQ